MIVMDDFLPASQADELESLLTGYDFQWYFLNFGTCSKQDIETHPEYGCNDRPQFSHMLWHYQNKGISNYFAKFKPLIDALEEKTGKRFASQLVRMKANMVMQDATVGVDDHHFPHPDLKTPAETLLYYANDADGDTFLFEERDFTDEPLKLAHRISPKKNRAILFRSDRLHAGASPRAAKYRTVVNVLFDKQAEMEGVAA